MQRNIVLIGMPASGKSTIGVLLAKTIGVGFVDTDLLIQQREHRLLQEIIDTDGIGYFLDTECAAVLDLDCQNTVIATGGSVVFRAAAMQKLRQNGTVVFLDVSLETVKRRLNNIKTRGVAADKGQSIDGIFYERLPYYRKYADIVLPSDGKTSEETVSDLIEILKNK